MDTTITENYFSVTPYIWTIAAIAISFLVFSILSDYLNTHYFTANRKYKFLSSDKTSFCAVLFLIILFADFLVFGLTDTYKFYNPALLNTTNNNFIHAVMDEKTTKISYLQADVEFRGEKRIFTTSDKGVIKQYKKDPYSIACSFTYKETGMAKIQGVSFYKKW